MPGTYTVVERLALPPGPSQVSVRVDVASMGPTTSLPEVALAPLHAPDAVHAVAFVDDHVSVEVPPLSTVVGFADRVTTGAFPATSATQLSASAW